MPGWSEEPRPAAWQSTRERRSNLSPLRGDPHASAAATSALLGMSQHERRGIARLIVAWMSVARWSVAKWSVARCVVRMK